MVRFFASLGLCLILANLGLSQEPLPIQRVLIDPERLPQELERAKQGRLITMTPEEFEEQVRLSSQSASLQRNPPRLTESRYQAVLNNQALVGVANWKFTSINNVPNLLSIGSLNLALRFPPNQGNLPPPIAEFDGKTTAVLLQKKDQANPIELYWSRAGDVRGDGITFELKIPMASISSLDLFLPANWAISVNEGSLLNGPLPLQILSAEKEKSNETPQKPNLDNQDTVLSGVKISPRLRELLRSEPVLENSLGQNCRVWTLQASGKDRLVFTLRKTDRPGPSRVLVNRQLTTQKILPDGLESTFELELTCLNRGIRELTCQLDPGLRPYSVTLRNLKDWEFQPGQSREQPSQLHLHLKEPIHEGTLKVSCLASLGTALKPADPISWTSPGLRVLQAVPRGENLIIRVHPDVRLEQWQSNGFHLRESVTEKESEDTLGWQRLILEGGGILPENNSKIRPTGSLRPYAVGFQTRQQAWWQLGANRHTLTLQMEYQVEAGRLFQLPVEIPQGWDVEKVEMVPAITQPSWQPPQSRNPRLLYVDLSRPLCAASSQKPFGDGDNPGSKGTLKVVLTSTSRRLKLANSDNSGQFKFPLPGPVAIGASWREGVLGISVDPIFQTVGITPNLATAYTDLEGPWGQATPDLIIPVGNQQLTATITVAKRPPQVRCNSTTLLTIGKDQTVFDSRIRLELDSGLLDSLDVQVANQPQAKWDWRIVPRLGGTTGTEGQTLKAERLSLPSELIAATSIVGVMSGAISIPLRSIIPSGIQETTWRINFGKPLRAGDSIDLQGKSLVAFLGGSPSYAVIPMVKIPKAYRMTGEIHLIRNIAGDIQANAKNLEEITRPYRPNVAIPSATTAGSAGSSVLNHSEFPMGNHTIWRSFRIGRNPGYLELVESGVRTDNQNQVQNGKILSPHLTIHMVPTGLLEHHARFKVEDWPDSVIPLTLPGNSRLLAIAVNGAWLNIPLNESTKLNDNMTLSFDLPVPRSGNPNEESFLAKPGTKNRHSAQYDIIYLRPLPDWYLWTTIKAVFPMLPTSIPPIQYRWKLPDEIQVLEGSTPIIQVNQPLQWFRALFTKSQNSSELDIQPWNMSSVTRRELVKQPITLLSLVDRLAEIASRDHRSLIIDLIAIGDLGLTVDMTFESPNEGLTGTFEKLGLKTLRLPGILLLSSQERAKVVSSNEDSLSNSIQEAIIHGIDSTQQFQNALDWLVQNPLMGSQQNPFYDSFFQPYGNSISGNEILGASELTVIQGHFLQGIVMTLTLFLAGWTLALRWKSQRTSHFFLLLWLGIAGLCWLWLPAALGYLAILPVLTGIVLLGITYVIFLLKRNPNAGEPHISPPRILVAGSGATTTGVVVLLLIAGLAGGQPGNPPTTVYLLPADAPGGGRMLVPPELLEKLLASQRIFNSDLTTPGVLLSSKYQCKATQNTVSVEAVFYAITFHPDSNLIIPLENVYLNGLTWLDDARVTVEPVEKTRERPAGFAIKIKDKGTHKVEIHFDVPVVPLTTRSQDRTFRVNLPKVSNGQLQLQAPLGAASILALGPLGWQHISPGEADRSGPSLNADLGAMEGPLQVTWFQDPGMEQHPGKVQYEEAYLWDLRGDAGNLTGLIHYRISAGTVRSLSLQVPPGLEVRNVEAFRAMISTGKMLEPILDGSVRLESWQIMGEGNDRTLVLFFQNPITGDLGVSLDLVPGAILPARLSLPVPASHGEPLPGPGYLAYHSQGLDVKRTQLVRATAINSAEFAPFWPLSSRPPTRSLQFCSEFRREGGQPPLLELNLTWQTRQMVIDQDLKFQVGTTNCEIRNRLEISSQREDLSRIEIAVVKPTFRVTSVTGPEVLYWSQFDGQLAIWLNRSVKKTSLEITALFPHGEMRPEGTLEIPRLLPKETSSVHTMLHIRADVGVQINLENLTGLTAKMNSNLSPPNWDYESNDPNFVALIRYSSVNAASIRSGGSRLLTLLEEVDQALQLTTTLLYRLRKGESKTLGIYLRDWPDVAIEVLPANIPFKVTRTDPGVLRFLIDLPPGTNELQQLTIRSQSNLEPLRKRGFSLPGITIKGLENSDSWVAIAGSELQTEISAELVPISLDSALHIWKNSGLDNGWARELERLQRVGGKIWHIGGNNPGLYLLPRPSPINKEVQVLLQEQLASWSDKQHWQHEAFWWLAVPDSTPTILKIPEGGQILSVSVDGSTVKPQMVRPGVWMIPMPGPGKYRQLAVRWKYDDFLERINRPRLGVPTLNDKVFGTILWTMRIPSHYVLKAGKNSLSLDNDRESAVLHSLYQCRTQARILSDYDPQDVQVKGHSLKQLTESRLAFWQHLAEMDLELLEKNYLSGPEGKTLAEWLAQIKTLGVSGLPIADGLAQGGNEGDWESPGPIYRGISFSGNSPVVTLESEETANFHKRLILSTQWIGILLMAMILSLFAQVGWLARKTWPEQLGGVGLILFLSLSLTAVGVLALFLAISARLRILLRHYQRSE